jgi:hypothetical protein
VNEQKEKLIESLESQVQVARSFVYNNNPLLCIIPSRLGRHWKYASDQFPVQMDMNGVANVRDEYRLEQLIKDIRHAQEKDYLITQT